MLNKSSHVSLALLWISFVLCGCNKPPPDKAWKEFSPSDGKFAVLMPGEASEEEKAGPGGMVSKTYQVITVLNNVRGMAVGYVDLKDVPKSRSEIDRVLERSRDQFRENLNGQLLNETSLSLGGYPGKEIQIVLPKGLIARQRIYLANRRLYNIMAITSRENIDSAEAKKFFDSFKILN